MAKIEPTPIGHSRKEAKQMMRYRCPFCQTLAWPSQFKKDINLDVVMCSSRGYKNWLYVRGTIAPDMYVKLRSFFVRRCFDILKKLQVTKVEVLSEFGMKDIAQDIKLLELTGMIDVGRSFNATETKLSPKFIEIKRNFNVER